MQPDIIDEYEATRALAKHAFRSACYAPYTSLYFDTRGNVRACCHNWSHVLGNIVDNSIDEIWRAAAARSLRRAVAAYDFSCGCEFCEWQLSSRSYTSVAMRKWDSLTTPSADPAWPQMMEFSISNRCNLECVMCDGNHSSAIRSHREGLPPLKDPYGDAFFSELRLYLPSLAKARFLGGEPFLQKSCHRIWDLMIGLSIAPLCHVTTNGTVYNARVERVLGALPVGITISLDGYRRETVESIRVNADHGSLIENVHRFRAYTAERRTSFSLSYCLMRPNWEEFGDFCLFADALDCAVGINLVRRPEQLSLFTLPGAELLEIVATLEKQAEGLLPKLRRNRLVWLGELERLRRHAAGLLKAPNPCRPLLR